MRSLGSASSWEWSLVFNILSLNFDLYVLSIDFNYQLSIWAFASEYVSRLLQMVHSILWSLWMLFSGSKNNQSLIFTCSLFLLTNFRRRIVVLDWSMTPCITQFYVGAHPIISPLFQSQYNKTGSNPEIIRTSAVALGSSIGRCLSVLSSRLCRSGFWPIFAASTASSASFWGDFCLNNLEDNWSLIFDLWVHNWSALLE